MNNPANMVDPNGYLAEFIWENKYTEVDAITSAAPVIPKPNPITKNTDSINSVTNINQKHVTDLAKGTVGGIGDEGLKKLANKLPSHIPYYANIAAVRSRRYLVIPIESVKHIKGTTAIGVIGLGMTTKSVWNNYHSGYSFGEATGRTSIDVGVAIFSIVAGGYTGGVGGIVAGTLLSGAGDIIKNSIWGER